MPFTDSQLEAISHFLNDVETKTPLERIQKEVDASRATVDTVNALIVVGAFIAGVQAQILSFTGGSNATALKAAANWFGFVGLTLDIIGAAAGVAHTIILQASMRQSQAMVQEVTARIAQTKDDVRNLLMQRRHSAFVDQHAEKHLEDKFRGLVNIAHTLIEEESAEQVHPIFSRVPGLAGASHALSRLLSPHGTPILSLTGLMGVSSALTRVASPAAPTRMFRDIPVIVMGMGALCILLSVICYAVDSQPRAVWISCVVITGVTLCAQSLPIGDPHRKRRAEFFKKIDVQLDQMPRAEGLAFPETRSPAASP
ncbi:hypothetical protein FA95DRAFT_1659286 [Auriscalpium vulgare]|uniref:Uncharacterized protein n=1 Tax=Auriscalpium vulgare TaxID=40419 RepID=A0ACB8RV14_9AGAM|nr:hypothetical protein FA95DRAFT_1659286 [Auriscalpium vulgare]